MHWDNRKGALRVRLKSSSWEKSKFIWEEKSLNWKHHRPCWKNSCLGWCPKILASPASQGLYCKLGFIFTAACKCLAQQPLHKPPRPSVLASFTLVKPYTTCMMLPNSAVRLGSYLVPSVESAFVWRPWVNSSPGKADITPLSPQTMKQ